MARPTSFLFCIGLLITSLIMLPRLDHALLVASDLCMFAVFTCTTLSTSDLSNNNGKLCASVVGFCVGLLLLPLFIIVVIRS